MTSSLTSFSDLSGVIAFQILIFRYIGAVGYISILGGGLKFSGATARAKPSRGRIFKFRALDWLKTYSKN